MFFFSEGLLILKQTFHYLGYHQIEGKLCGKTRLLSAGLCDQDLFSSVAHFVVKEPSFFSDHSPVMTWLNVETNIRNKNVAHANDT